MQPGAGWGEAVAGDWAKAAAHEDALGRALPWSHVDTSLLHQLPSIMATESFASGSGDVGRRGRAGDCSVARRAATGTGMGVEEKLSVSPGLACFLLPEPKPFCARLCVPSLPLSPVPRTPGFWDEPVHWVSSLNLEIWDGDGQSMGACSVHQWHAHCL